MLIYWVEQPKGTRDVKVYLIDVLRVHKERVYFHEATGKTWANLKSEHHQVHMEPEAALEDARNRVASLRLLTELELCTLRANEDRIMALTPDTIPDHSKRISYA